MPVRILGRGLAFANPMTFAAAVYVVREAARGGVGHVAMREQSAWFVRPLGFGLAFVDQVKRQLDNLQPLLALVHREEVAGRGQMLKQRVNDRVERGSVYGVQLGLAWLLGDCRLLWMTVGAARGP